MKTTQYPEKSIEQQITDLEKSHQQEKDQVIKLVKQLLIALAVVIVGFSTWILILIYN